MTAAVSRGAFVILTLAINVPVFAQPAASVLCQMDRIATAGIGDNGKSESKGEPDEGEIVLSGLNTANPSGSGNIGNEQLQIMKRTADAVWLVEKSGNGLADGVGVITYFFKTKIILYSKQELLTTTTGDQPFGLIEIGHCRPSK